MPLISAIHRHPVKAMGHEALERIPLAAGAGLPGDRAVAVLHERSTLEADEDGWARCTTFLRGAMFPSLMAIRSRGAPDGPITFQHPDRPPLTVELSTPAGEAAFLAWIDPLIPEGKPRPAALHRAARAITDSRDKGLVSVMSDASLGALSAAMGVRLARARFRGNLWLSGLAPWAETGLAGRTIRIGAARLRLIEPIERCSATLANPDTGRRDADVLGGLDRQFGHADFGMKAQVVAGGEIALGDRVEIL